MQANYFPAEPMSYSGYNNIMSTVIPSPEKESLILDYPESLHDISELIWLNVTNNTEPSITLDETNKVYQVLLNTVSKQYLETHD